MSSPTDEPSGPDWDKLHRQHHADRGRKVALSLMAISALLFVLVAVVVAVAG